jgi:proteasome lid subunit RPN8/RPN11
MSNNLKSINEGWKVIIKRDAFRNIITHILRFGSKLLENPQQAMGLCLGAIDENGRDIIITNAIPITHGDRIEEEFSEDIKNIIEQVDHTYQENNLNVYGWYHSHIDLGIFYSSSDLKNQQYFQLKEGPYDFGIVVDPSEIKKNSNLGFKVFHLNEKDPDGYSEKEYELEKPNDLEIFKWVQKFMEDFHKKSPVLIKEIKESKQPSSLDLDTIPETLVSYDEDIFDDSLAQEGLDSYFNNLKNIIKGDIGIWMNDISSGAIEGGKKLKESTEYMKDNVPLGVSKIKRWFNNITEELTNNFKLSVTEYINDRMQTEKDVINSLIELLNDFKSIQNEKIDNYITKILNRNQEEIINITEKINNIKEISLDLKEFSSSLDSILEKYNEDLSNDITNNVGKALKKEYNAIINLIINQFNEVKDKLINEKESQSEILELIKNLQKMILTIRNL